MNEGSQYSIHSICRICLNQLQNETAYDLFLIPGLAKKLCVCTSLSVEPQDGFPKNLCGVCYTRLNDLHEFQRMCVDSVEKFQDMVANNSFDCGPVNAFDMLDANVANDGEMPGEDEDRINFDPLLNHKMELIENEEDVFKMLEHVDKEAEEVEKEVAQENKEKSSLFSEDSASEADNDMDKDFEPIDQHSDSDEDDDAPLAQRLRRSTAAKKRKTKNDSDWDDDDDESDDDSKKDPDANVGSKVKPKRKRIPAAERHMHKIIECHICHQKFKKSKNYQEHMKYHNDLLPFQCKVETCKKGFTTAGGLRLHVDHAHTELAEVHKCSVEGCDKTFPRMRLLTWHHKKVHNITKATAPPRNHPCTECEKVFRCPMALKKHMYKHDGKELPFPCNICGKRFVINSALKDHLMRHAGIKNYVCPYCGVGKTTRQEWNTHILTHTQEKKFKCTMCEHASHNKQSLANHIKIVHEKIKNYACQYCGKTFGKSHACKIHEMTHTGEKRCECKVCGKKFLYPKSLTKHLKTHEKRVLRAIETYRKRQAESGDGTGDPDINLEAGLSQDGITPVVTQNATDELLKVCAESVATIPRDPRRVERVDLAQLAGTVVNPIPSVSVPSWSPQVNFTKKEGKHICPGCGQGFNNIGNMKRHYKIIHEKVKDFACRFCEKRFAKAQTLKHHEWTHTGEKPYECQTCGTRFRQDVALKRHQKVHQKVLENRPPKIPAKFYMAREELEIHERNKLEAKRKREMQRNAIAEAAKEQLELLEKDGEKVTGYDKYFVEKAVASAELQEQEREKNEAFRKAERERQAIADAAFQQLEVLQKKIELEKSQTTYDGYYAQKVALKGEDPKVGEGINLLDHV